MKPHEQTWMVIPAPFGPWHVIHKGNGVATVGDGCANRDTADLIASAPEMARLLLELGALPHHDRPPRVPLPVHYLRCESCGSEMVKPASSENHMDGCRLVAVLRKAGVLP